MARLVAAFGSSHSAMLFSAADHWQAGFDHVDCRAPINDMDGRPRDFAELLASRPANAAALMAPAAIAERHRQTARAMDALEARLMAAGLDVLIIVGDDQREIFQDASRPAIAIHCGPTIRNRAAPDTPASDWYTQDQYRRLEDGEDRHYPCHADLAAHLVSGLNAREFDLTVMRALEPAQCEGHAFSFIHRRYMRQRVIPIVPVFLNTYYPPNQPTPRRCFALGAAIRDLVASFPQDLRVGLLASGGLSHFLVNETLDHQVIAALRARDDAALQALPLELLHTGSSEIRNWITLAGALPDRLALDWIDYVPGYRSQALTGVGLCFAHWTERG